MDANERRVRASREATEWWLLLQGEMPATERQQFVDWLRESSVHVVEMLRVVQVHGALESFERWARIPTDGTAEDVATSVVSLTTRAESAADPRPKRRVGHVWSIAATLAAIAIVGSLLPALRDQVIQTERAERREVVLADGSVVQVDPQSRLRVAFERDTRNVFLERGRALFHVAKDPGRPFMVRADETVVRAIGTAFGVERRTSAIVVTVAEGRVAVVPANEQPPLSTSGRQTAAATSDSSMGRSGSVATGEVFLTAGYQVIVQSTGSAEPVRRVNSGRELAWAEGLLVFEKVPIADVIEQFNRYNRVQLRITAEALARRPISGTFNASDPEALLAFLQASAPVRIVRDHEQITISTGG